MTHFVIHNSQAANGDGMEIFEVSDAKKMLDRIVQIFDGEEMNGISKKHAGMLLDGRFDEICPRNPRMALRDMCLSTSSGKSVYIYAARLGTK